jgi:hypothetical protein
MKGVGIKEVMKTKKPWSKPEVRRLPATDELLDLVARSASRAGTMPAKQVK